MSLGAQTLVNPADGSKMLPLQPTFSHVTACAFGRLVKVANREMFSLLGSAIVPLRRSCRSNSCQSTDMLTISTEQVEEPALLSSNCQKDQLKYLTRTKQSKLKTGVNDDCGMG